VLKALGPVRRIAEELAEIDGVEEAWLFGSWARRYLGEAGGSPADIDLLVVGRPELDALATATPRAGGTLGRPVGSTVLTREEWTRASSGFVRAVRDGARVRVLGDER